MLSALNLPTEKVGDQKPFSLGSLRPGGAAWLLHKTENAQVVRRRGRWLSVKTLEIYLQGVQVSTYLERVRPAAKVLIELCSGGLATTLDRCIDFLQCGVPSTTWFYLCQNFLRRDLKRLGKMELSIHQTILEANRTIRSTAAKQKGECLDLKTLTECFWGSKPPTRGPTLVHCLAWSSASIKQ